MGKNFYRPQAAVAILFTFACCLAYADGSSLKINLENDPSTKNDATLIQEEDFDPPTITATFLESRDIRVTLTDHSNLDETYEISGENFFQQVQLPDSGQTVNLLDVEGFELRTAFIYQYNVDVLLKDGTFLTNVAHAEVLVPLLPPEFGPARLPYDESNSIKFSLQSLNGISTHEIYRSLSPTEGFQLVHSQPHHELSFIDTNVEPEQTYYYKVRAVHEDPTFNSAFTEVRTYRTGSFNYNPSLTATAKDENTIELTLVDHEFNDAFYMIVADDFSETVAMPDSGSSVTLTHDGLTPGSTHSYRVIVFMKVYPDAFIEDVAFAMATPGAQGCANTGAIDWQVWTGIGGTSVSAIPLNEPPDAEATLTSFQTPPNYDHNFGGRVRGYICPPQSGSYVFWIASDDNGELWLSSDENPAHKAMIASVPGYVKPGQWTKYPSQRSAPIELHAGTRYYIEALYKEALSADHLTVGWTLPNGVIERPIPGANLMRFEPEAAACEGAGSIVREIWLNIDGTEISSVPFNTEPDETVTYTSFETNQYYANNYGSRMRAFICPPVTGAYVFRIASDDRSELWFSTDENSANKMLIASVPGHTQFRQWDKYSSQASAEMNLTAGQKYYVEVLHKEIGGNDHISVAWDILATNTFEGPIPGRSLIPFEGSTEPAICAGPNAGFVQREVWRGITGTSISSIPVDSPPDDVVDLTEFFETGTYYANDYGSRVRGYLCVPQTGSYTFWISSDDASELWLSADDSPSNKIQIASVGGHTHFRVWDKYATQQSAPIHLVAGQPYYVEVLHKEAGGNDHISVGWQLPDGTMERPMPASRLVAFEPFESSSSTALADGRETMSDDSQQTRVGLYPNPAHRKDITLSIMSERISEFKVAQVQVISFTGETVFNQQIRCEGDCAGIPIQLQQNTPPGIYLVKVEVDGEFVTDRLVIK